MQEKIRPIIRPLLEWYAKNRKMYPWRQDKDPYHVWISEIMLQQTRIEAVKEYYTRFIRELPDAASLSAVSEEKLLKLWEGLGYYSRAKNLHKAARTIMEQYNGSFPATYNELLKLSGIGEYTAGAIASICFGEKVPAVDGNVLRVLARLLGSDKNVLLPEVRKEASALLRTIMPDEPGNFNEALMELGENICLPNGTPACENCPLKEHCIAFQYNLTAVLPVRIKQVKRRQEQKTILLIVSSAGKIAIEQRPAKGLLSGMYQLPNINGEYTPERLKELLNEWQLMPLSVSFLGNAKHIFTHIDWLMQGYRIETESESDRFLWVTEKELSEKYPLPTAFKHFMK